MDFLTILEGHLHHAAAGLHTEGLIAAMPATFRLNASRQCNHGDFTTAIAMAPGGETGPARRLVAERMAARLRAFPDFSRVDVAGPGYLNISVAGSAWRGMLASILSRGGDYGRATRGQGRVVDIGFLPVGGAPALPPAHARCGVVGDALANLFDFEGFTSSRPYSVNGGGAVTVRLGQPLGLLQGGRQTEWHHSLVELEAEIGADAARLGMLMHRNGAPVTLDTALLAELANDNPLFRVQYAHARCCSLRKKGSLAFPDPDQPAKGHEASWDVGAFEDEGARLILRRLALYPRQIDAAGRSGEPSWLAEYLVDLAGDLHAHYNRSLAAPHLRFIRDDDRLLTGARLALVRGVETVLKSGLALLGVSAPDEIR